MLGRVTCAATRFAKKESNDSSVYVISIMLPAELLDLLKTCRDFNLNPPHIENLFCEIIVKKKCAFRFSLLGQTQK